jgi:putative RecB family exonuclease
MNLSDITQRPHWSYSSLNQLLNICSLQYYFQRIAKITPAFSSPNLVLGSAYHRSLEQVYLAKKNGSVFTAEQALEFFTASWNTALEDKKVRFSRLSADETAQQGRSLLQCAVKHIDPDEEILSVSEPFIVPVACRGKFMELPLVGEFDLTVRKESRPAVVDWKTSAKRWSAGQADRSLQATVYTYAYQQKFGINPEVRFDVTVKNRTPVFEQHETTRTPESWDRMSLLVNKAESIVKHQCFYPAETSFYCSDCPYSDACKAWHQEQVTENKRQQSATAA